jgi:polyisoprenoid-binding protein YceI
MIAIPLTGWIYVSAATEQIPTKLFFTLPIPHLPIPVSGGLAERFSGFHEFLAFAMLGLFGLHVAAAAKHHLIGKDDVIPRMAGRGRWPSLIALAFAGLMAAAILATILSFSGEEDTKPAEEASVPLSPASATTPATGDSPYSWTILPEGTYLDVTVTGQSAPRHARIDGISGLIILDPDAPETQGRIDVVIDTRSLSSDESMVKQQASGDGWLNTGRYPEARFQSDAITRKADGRYLAEGTLTLKDISAPLTLDFTLTLQDTQASAKASAQFDRSVFGIGISDTEDFTVTTDISIDAMKAE